MNRRHVESGARPAGRDRSDREHRSGKRPGDSIPHGPMLSAPRPAVNAPAGRASGDRRQTRKTAAPQVKPAPKTVETMRSPFLTVPFLRWVSIVSGTLAAVVLPYI